MFSRQQNSITNTAAESLPTSKFIAELICLIDDGSSVVPLHVKDEQLLWTILGIWKE